MKQSLVFPFFCHISATTRQIESNKVWNSKLKLDLCNCVKTEIIEFIAPPQKPQKGHNFFGTPST